MRLPCNAKQTMPLWRLCGMPSSNCCASCVHLWHAGCFSGWQRAWQRAWQHLLHLTDTR